MNLLRQRFIHCVRQPANEIASPTARNDVRLIRNTVALTLVIASERSERGNLRSRRNYKIALPAVRNDCW
jgi:hypothetical protein